MLIQLSQRFPILQPPKVVTTATDVSKISTFKINLEESESEEEEEEERDADAEVNIANDLTKKRQPVCLSQTLPSELTECLFCGNIQNFRGNMLTHLKQHGFYESIFCKTLRDKSELPEGYNKGCRKLYTVKSYEFHTCTLDNEEQHGHFPVGRDRVYKKPKKKKRWKFGTPDGSPAKFYCDGYTKLFHRLAARDGHNMKMDATFVRNGQVELVYLTAGQMAAVREFCRGSDKYYLVYFLQLLITFLYISLDIYLRRYAHFCSA